MQPYSPLTACSFSLCKKGAGHTHQAQAAALAVFAPTARSYLSSTFLLPCLNSHNRPSPSPYPAVTWPHSSSGVGTVCVSTVNSAWPSSAWPGGGRVNTQWHTAAFPALEPVTPILGFWAVPPISWLLSGSYTASLGH